MRNQNGTGSVYKLSGKRRKPWAVSITKEYTTDGRQIRKLIGTFETKREAQEILIKYVKNPNLFKKILFKDIREMWWEAYKKKVTNESTLNTHLYRIRALDSLNELKIQDIKLYDMQEIFDNMETSWSFRNACKSVLNMIFDFALKNELVESNRVKFIEIGQRVKVIDRKIFTKEEIETLWKNLDSETYHGKFTYIILILIYTGMRIGELINLKNEDIDLHNSCLKVNVSKTSAGIRVIPISSRIFNLFITKMVKDQEHFVKGITTTQLSYTTFKDRFQTLLKELGIREHTIHDTRHTFATLLNNANANQSSIIKLIGHSDFSITENVYTHKDTEELRKAVELLQ
ncbi:MAG: tyrosine-type recombinase/integrase [Cetobacterium sp.]